MLSIYQYNDYRKFLKDFFDFSKQNKRGFSYRTFADKAGFKARDYILRVINGGRNLSKIGVIKLAKAMDLSDKQADFFENLVYFNQAKTPDEKRHFLGRLMAVGKYGKYQKFRQDQFDCYSTWYHSAILTLLPVKDFGDDYAALARSLNPEITPKQARDSVELLLRLGLLERTAKGRYKVCNPALTTGDEVTSLAVTNYHKTLLEMAKRAVDVTPAQMREVSCVTLAISKNGFDKVRNEIREFERRVMDIANSDSSEDRVYQLGLQLFPLTRGSVAP
jgi:uncharacterized protein (TIGR02147 family)